MRKILSLAAVAALLLSLCACGAVSEPMSTGPAVYRAVASPSAGSGLLQPSYLALQEGEDPLALMARAVSGGAPGPGLRPVLPDGVTLLSYQLQGRELTLSLSDAYLSLSGMDKTLCDACLTLSFCSVDGVGTVSISVDGTVRTPGLAASDILLYDTEENPYERQLRLYFSSGGYLSPEYHTLSVDRGAALERYVLEELLHGPYSSALNSAIPAGTGLLGISTDGGLCTVDLSGEFLTEIPGSVLGEHLALYAIVDSLTSLSEVTSVSFTVEGAPLTRYGSHDLSGPLQRDEHAIGPANAAKGEADIHIYVPLPGGGFAALPRVVSLDDYASLPEAVASEMVSGDPEPCFSPLFPEGARLNFVSLSGGLCTVDFPADTMALFSSPAAQDLAMAGLRDALRAVSGVGTVRFTVDGSVYHNQ